MKRSTFPKIVISAGARTPVGVKCGTLSSFSPEDLAVLACEEAINRCGIERKNIDFAVGANVYQYTAPHGQDLYFPRNVGLRCKLNIEAPALMVQRICGSGIQTMISAFQQIALPDIVDDSQIALCFGAESMSRTPQIKRSARVSGASFWDFEPEGKLEDTILVSLDHSLANTSMMVTADEYAAGVGITRKECDEFAVLSHKRARDANSKSHFNGGDYLKGMFAIDACDQNGRSVHMAKDECIRDTNYEALAKLPGFTKNKLVSPGNASEISDGAGAVIVADRARAEVLGLSTRYEIAGYGLCGVEPRIMGKGPVPSIHKALSRAGIKQEDVGLWEINEAFAAQYLGVERELSLDREITNVNGGAVAIGHPLAATGVRLVVDLIYEMERRGVEYGCASACIGGGQGAAIIIRDTEI